MEQDLRNRFENFKRCTLESITSLQNDDFDSLHNLLIKRQEILDSINGMNSSKEECRDIVNDLDIESLEKSFTEIMEEKRRELKHNIDIIERNKTAANNYNKVSTKKAIIFSKKI